MSEQNSREMRGEIAKLCLELSDAIATSEATLSRIGTSTRR